MTVASIARCFGGMASFAAVLLLGACVEVPLFHTGAEPEAPASAASAAPAAASTASAQVTQAAARPTQAARAQSAPVVPPEPAVAGTTIETVRAECWMKVENDHKAPRDLDKRVKLVAACVDERSKALAAQGVPLAQ